MELSQSDQLFLIIVVIILMSYVMYKGPEDDDE